MASNSKQINNTKRKNKYSIRLSFIVEYNCTSVLKQIIYFI